MFRKRKKKTSTPVSSEGSAGRSLTGIGKRGNSGFCTMWEGRAKGIRVGGGLPLHWRRGGGGERKMTFRGAPACEKETTSF